MPVRAVDDKPSDTLVVVSGERFWTGSSTLPHLHHHNRAGLDWIQRGAKNATFGIALLGLDRCAAAGHGVREPTDFT